MWWIFEGFIPITWKQYLRIEEESCGRVNFDASESLIVIVLSHFSFDCIYLNFN